MSGVKLGELVVPTTVAGNPALLTWVKSHGRTRGFAVEGTGSYGASLPRYLLGAGEFVIEAARPRRDRQAHRNKGRTDSMDALRAARALLAEDLDIAPKDRDGEVEVLRMLLIVRRTAVKARTQAINAMRRSSSPPRTVCVSSCAMRTPISSSTGACGCVPVPPALKLRQSGPCACWRAGVARLARKSTRSTPRWPRWSNAPHRTCWSWPEPVPVLRP
jgi:hypothetical protein